MKYFALILLLCEIGAYAGETEKLVGAKNADIGAYPYQVSLKVKKKHFCGGALITKKHVLTAAHCVYPIKNNPLLKKYFTVVVGTNSVIYGGESYTASNISYYEKYTDKMTDPDFMYDIGVITLFKEVKLSKFVKIIPLPTKEVKGGEDAVVTGWGSMRGPDSLASRALQYLDVRVISNSKCQLYYFGVRKIAKSQICTFKERGYGTCTGDSGGPLISDGELVGVVSGGVACAKGFPDIYTRVSYYRDYIEEIVGDDFYVDKVK